MEEEARAGSRGAAGGGQLARAGCGREADRRVRGVGWRGGARGRRGRGGTTTLLIFENGRGDTHCPTGAAAAGLASNSARRRGACRRTTSFLTLSHSRHSVAAGCATCCACVRADTGAAWLQVRGCSMQSTSVPAHYLPPPCTLHLSNPPSRVYGRLVARSSMATILSTIAGQTAVPPCAACGESATPAPLPCGSGAAARTMQSSGLLARSPPPPAARCPLRSRGAVVHTAAADNTWARFDLSDSSFAMTKQPTFT